MVGGLVIAVILIALLVIIFDDQIYYVVDSTKTALASMITGKKPRSRCKKVVLFDDDDMGMEHLNNPKITTTIPTAEVASTLGALGFTADAPWDEVLAATELDPSTFVNHMDFVKDVRRFSSGANFTSVTDDNTNIDFTGFIGLRRPSHVPIGVTARQTPDIDESVLQRNKILRW